MTRFLPLLLALAGCAGPGGSAAWTVQGAPVQAHWEVVVQAAYDSRICTFNWTHMFSFDDRWGGVITFHDGPFPCLGASGTDPERLCNGLTDSPSKVQINGAQTPDVLAGTLPWEMANVILAICDDDYTETKTAPLCQTITTLARSRMP
jgi:hypothetical protein